MAKHNKKRNVGLLHEQLVRHVSEMIVEGSKEKADQSVQILLEHFNQNSELLKEFRLFRSLIHTRVEKKDLARRIIEESRRACGDHDPNALRREKSLLIRDINHKIVRKDFYSQHIDEYKLFSTVQALLNEWRGNSKLSPDEIVMYEAVLEEHLYKNECTNDLEKTTNADPLVLNIMLEKFNEKYSMSLSDDQKSILKAQLFGDDKLVVEQSINLKDRAAKSLQEFYDKCDNAVIRAKRKLLEEKIDSFVPDSSDESVTRTLMIANLLKEIEVEK